MSLKSDKESQQSATRIIKMSVMNSVTSKAAAEYDRLFNKSDSEAGLLSKSSHSAVALGVTNFINALVKNAI